MQAREGPGYNTHAQGVIVDISQVVLLASEAEFGRRQSGRRRRAGRRTLVAEREEDTKQGEKDGGEDDVPLADGRRRPLRTTRFRIPHGKLSTVFRLVFDSFLTCVRCAVVEWVV